MPALQAAYPVSAIAYVRVSLASGEADLICGPQLSCVLDDLSSPGDDVVICQGGMFLTREPGGTQVQYEPVHRSSWRYGCTADSYTFTLYRRAVAEPRGVVSGQQMRDQADRARGVVYGLQDGSAVLVYRGLLAARWTPLTDQEGTR